MTTAVPKKPNKPTDEPLFSKQVAFRITDRDLFEAVEELIAEQEYPTTFTDVMVIALREHMKKKGKYPRPRRKPPAD
jgi:hypothetical protein